MIDAVIVAITRSAIWVASVEPTKVTKVLGVRSRRRIRSRSERNTGQFLAGERVAIAINPSPQKTLLRSSKVASSRRGSWRT